MTLMADKNKRTWIVLSVYFLSILLTLSFIFGNSLFSKEESSEQSGQVVEVVKPIVDPKDEIPREDFEHSVRKLAHFAEFALLGFETALLALYISGGFKLRDALHASLFGLLSANTDELIQSFTERGSSVTDVFIDFSGVIFGIAFGYAAAVAVKAVIKRKRDK